MISILTKFVLGRLVLKCCWAFWSDVMKYSWEYLLMSFQVTGLRYFQNHPKYLEMCFRVFFRSLQIEALWSVQNVLSKYIISLFLIAPLSHVLSFFSNWVIFIIYMFINYMKINTWETPKYKIEHPKLHVRTLQNICHPNNKKNIL